MSLKNLFYSTAEHRLRAGWRLITHLFILITITAILSISIELLQKLLLDKRLLILDYIGLAAGMTISIWIARRFIDKRSFQSLGLNWNRKSIKEFVLGIVIAAIMMAGIFIVEQQLGWIAVDGIIWTTSDGTSVMVQLLVWLLLFFLVAWTEELYSRGYLLQNLSVGLNLPLGVLLSSLLFSLAHLGNPSASILSVTGILAAGLFFAYSYVRTKRLWLVMGLHFGWNFFEGPIFGFPVSGLETVKLIQQTPIGPDLITGGAFGPEAGLILYPMLAIGTVIVHWVTRQNDMNIKTRHDKSI